MEWKVGEFEGDWFSDCGEYHIAFYPLAPSGAFYAAYKKDTFHHYGTKKAYRAFGNDFVYNDLGKNQFPTFNDVAKKVESYCSK